MSSSSNTLCNKASSGNFAGSSGLSVALVGAPWAVSGVRTTGAAARLLMAPDRAAIRGDGLDLSYITVTVADQDGQLVPRSKNALKFTVSGPGEIVATDNGDATSFESFQSPERQAYNGLALVIVRAKKGASGAITVRAESAGLTTGETTITAR